MFLKWYFIFMHFEWYFKYTLSPVLQYTYYNNNNNTNTVTWDEKLIKPRTLENSHRSICDIQLFRILVFNGMDKRLLRVISIVFICKDNDWKCCSDNSLRPAKRTKLTTLGTSWSVECILLGENLDNWKLNIYYTLLIKH